MTKKRHLYRKARRAKRRFAKIIDHYSRLLGVEEKGEVTLADILAVCGKFRWVPIYEDNHGSTH